MSALVNFLKRIYQYRAVIATMALHEFQSRYLGTFAGFLWSVINPLAMMLVFWFVFSVGFKSQPVENIPYIVYFLIGFIPWNFFSETVMTSTQVITRNSHLVTKSVFPTEILVIVSLASNLIGHFIMLLIFIIIILFTKMALSFYSLQFIFYLIPLSVMAIGLGWIVSALNVFYKDVGQITGIIMNIWFWMTPIVWVTDSIPKEYQSIIRLNPMYFIVEGYRAAFIHRANFWNEQLIYFWALAIAMFFIGGVVFRKLKSEFAEVL